MVRFAKWSDILDIDDWTTTPKSHLGLLVNHDPVMKISHILFEDEILPVRSQLVEKAGKKDFEEEADLTVQIMIS